MQLLVAKKRVLAMGESILERTKYDGLFLTVCPVHSVTQDYKFFQVKANGKTVQQALVAWALYCKDKSHHHLDDMPQNLRNHTEQQPLDKVIDQCNLKEDTTLIQLIKSFLR